MRNCSFVIKLPAMQNQCISFLLLCLLSTGLPAQSQDQYFHFMEKGEKAMASEDEAELANAELFFIAAKSTVGISPEQTGRAEEKRKEAREKFLRVVRDAKAEAEEQEKRARYQARIGEALGRAYMAMEQVGIDSNQVALYLAYVAYDTIRQSPHELDHFVKKSFGNTIYANFAHATQAHAGAIPDLTFNATGDRLLTRSWDHTAGLWTIQADTLRLLARLSHDNFIHSAVFSKDGRRILTTSADSTARLWTADGQPVATLRGHTGEVLTGAFTKDGYLLTGSRDGTVRLWDEAGEHQKTLPLGAGPILRLICSQDCDRPLVATASRLALWDPEADRLDTLTLPGAYFYPAEFSDDGDHLLAPASNGEALFYRPSDGAQMTLPHPGIVYRAYFLPSGKGMLTIARDDSARLWSPAGDLLVGLPLPADGIASAAFSPDGSHLVLLSQSRTPSLWDIGTLTAPDSIPLTGHAAPVTTAAFAPDGQTLLTGSADGTAKLWDLHGHVLMDLTGFDGPVTAVAFTLDGDYLLAAGADGSLVICEMPEVAYERLQAEPPKLSEEKKKAFEIR